MKSPYQSFLGIYVAGVLAHDPESYKPACRRVNIVDPSEGDNINIELISQMMAHEDNEGALNIHPDPP